MVLLRNRIAGKLVAPSSQALTVQCWNNRFPSPTQGQAYKDSLNSPILATPSPQPTGMRNRRAN